ncbi:serine/threonine-protein kinase [Mycobacterium sp. pUA109]|uniref:serine/threonine-protein kinase n=1 Tax=Mycobacterium sp. pUA109 TaxID=3238982 RepID=UPI00351B5BEC
MDSTAGVGGRGSRVGSVFGKYRLTRLLGAGGFGEVYEAEDTVMHRRVALKLLNPTYGHDPGFRERLFREARTAGALNEPHVVPVHGCGEIDGQLYIDMRLINGNDLAVVLKRGPLEPDRAVGIVAHVGAALDAAHAAGMVHRDVKPANILLTDDDFAYLVDFGLANAAADTKLTSTGTTIGTFAYLAPERLTHNADVRASSDIYSLTCVLYEMLTGTPPYTSVDLPQLISAHLTAPIPRPSRHDPALPAALDDVIVTGMAKNPADRYPNARELVRAARHAIGQTPARVEPHAAPTQAAPHNAPTQLAPGSMQPAPPVPPQPYFGAPATAKPPRPMNPQRERRGSRAAVISALAMIATLLTATVIAAAGIGPFRPAPPPPPPPPITTLAFNGLQSAGGLAVDSTGNAYVIDDQTRVLKLPPGAAGPTVLQAFGYQTHRIAQALAVDTADDLYVVGTDYSDRSRGAGRGVIATWKLVAVQAEPSTIALPEVHHPTSIAVDSRGSVYVTDGIGSNGLPNSGQVWKLSAGDETPTLLPFPNLDWPNAVTVDPAGAVYVATSGHTSSPTDDGRPAVWKLDPDAALPAKMPGLEWRYTSALATDVAGNLYGADGSGAWNSGAWKLAAGTSDKTDLPFTVPEGVFGIAVDAEGNVYLGDRADKDSRVLKLDASYEDQP